MVEESGTIFAEQRQKSMKVWDLRSFKEKLTVENLRDPAIRFAKTLLLSSIAFAVFLGAWSLVAATAEVRTGKIPGPLGVAQQAKALWDDHWAEKEKEREFYVQQAERKEKFLATFPDREWKERKYAGKDTFFQQIGTSLKTVFTGFLIASLIGIPIGILCGASQRFYLAVNPLIQVFKPVSPLAWLPVVMILVSAWYNPENPMFEKAFLSSAIVVALCSIWPTMINTANGVVSVSQDHLNVARILNLGWFTRVFKIVIPSALPHIFTGLRLSLGIGWMVLIAAEMLAQNPGLGKFIWDMFQNGSSETLAQILVAVFTIGTIGFAMDKGMIALQKAVTFDGQMDIR